MYFCILSFERNFCVFVHFLGICIYIFKCTFVSTYSIVSLYSSDTFISTHSSVSVHRYIYFCINAFNCICFLLYIYNHLFECICFLFYICINVLKCRSIFFFLFIFFVSIVSSSPPFNSSSLHISFFCIFE